jgi:hypothetical protein
MSFFDRLVNNVKSTSFVHAPGSEMIPPTSSYWAPGLFEGTRAGHPFMLGCILQVLRMYSGGYRYHVAIAWAVGGAKLTPS